MKVLITGGYGFIGSHVAERFFKEGYEVIIIDNLSGGHKENLTVKHKEYILSVEDDSCAEVFRVHNIDVVVHLAKTDNRDLSVANYRRSTINNISGLINIMDLARQYGVKKVILPSDTTVYGDLIETVSEQTIVNPHNHAGISRLTEETYCINWHKIYDIPIVILRISNVYGSRQKRGDVFDILKSLASNSDNKAAYAADGEDNDYIYVADVVDAIYKAATRDLTVNIINVAQGNSTTLQEISNYIGKLATGNEGGGKPMPPKMTSSLIDNTLCIQSLGWQAKYDLAEGLENTYRWYINLPPKVEFVKPDSVWHSFKTKILPYIENVVLFAMVSAITLLSDDISSINADIGIDYSFVYIAIMGLLYGKAQSLLATALAMGLLCYSRILAGTDFVSLLYQAKPMFHLAMYLLVGVLTGYVTDHHDLVVHNMQIAVNNLRARYEFLEERYLDTIKIKDKLYKQLINSGDSIGRLYSIIQKLDSIETENIYTSATQITAEIMEVSAVAIYTMGKNKYYLRQKIKSAKAADNLPKSIQIEKFDYLHTVMQDKKIFVNKDLQPDLPDMAAPVICNDKVVAVLQIYNVPFENMDLQHETLLKVTSKLISDALGRAYVHELSIQDKKYVPGTRILLAEEFAKIRQEMNKREISQKNIALFKIIQNDTNSNLSTISDTLDRVIREEDFVGLSPDGDINILLVDIPQDIIPFVQKRIQDAGVLTILLKDD